MPKLSSYRRIITNDFKKEERPLVEKMASPLNDSFNELYFAANGRLSLNDNIYCTVKDLEIIVDAKGNPTQTTSFNLDKPGSVLGCQVLYAANQVNTAIYPTGQPFVSFVQSGAIVIINNITSLQANQRYIIRVVAYLN
jgi:hypothetical protein